MAPRKLENSNFHLPEIMTKIEQCANRAFKHQYCSHLFIFYGLLLILFIRKYSRHAKKKIYVYLFTIYLSTNGIRILHNFQPSKSFPIPLKTCDIRYCVKYRQYKLITLKLKYLYVQSIYREDGNI